MTIILFIVDNSISMCQKTYSGCSLLDTAKKAVETFLKFRQRDFNHRADRIMLMTFEEPPVHLKAGWKESLLVFQNELKNIQATSVCSGSQIISSAFELLNVNRLCSGVDTYGQGRNPYYLESAVIILLTDGRSFSAQPEMNLTMNNRIPGMELNKEPHRWDQRVFSVVLKIPGVRMEEKPAPEDLARDESVLDGLSCMTGGRSFVIDSAKAIDPVMLKIADNMQSGVVCHFEPLEEAAFSTTSISVTRMVYLPKTPQKAHASGYWPLPEPYWPDLRSSSLPPARGAHPVFRYKPCMEDLPVLPLINDIPLPVDRYEVENSPLTQEVADKSERFKHWQVFIDAEVADAGTIHQLCGYLAIQPTGLEKTLVLNVLPVDYPRLVELFDKYQRNPSKKEWKMQFDSYIQSIPAYAVSALRRFLLKANLYTLIPESFDQCLSHEFSAHLRKSKNQAKLISDNTQAFPNQISTPPDLISVLPRNWKNLAKRDGTVGDEIGQSNGFDDLLARSLAEQNEADVSAFRIHLRSPAVLHQRSYINLHRNPFDVEREDLVSQLGNLKFSLMHPDRWKGVEEPDKNIPIAQMGNYQDYLKAAPQPLRDIDETPKFERPMFGNPFANRKRQRSASASMVGMVDEADVDLSNSSAPPRPRRPASEPRDFGSSNPSSKMRSRNATPGLRSPVKASRTEEPPDQSANEVPFVPSSSTDALAPSKRKLALDSGPEETSAAPSAVVVELVNGIEEKPRVNGISSNGNGAIALDEEPDVEVVRDYSLRALRTIKKPGRNFTPILDLINEINGNVKLKKIVIERIIDEAGRFRRESLINLLRETYAM